MNFIEHNYMNIARGLVELFSPLAEVVIHDLKHHAICFIKGPNSTRQVGEPSYLSDEDRAYPVGNFSLYHKVGDGGRQQKSASLVLGDENNKPRYLLCINMHIDELHVAQNILAALTTIPGNSDLKEFFEENWQDRINRFIQEFLKKRGSSLQQLSRSEKKKLVLDLKQKGAFNGKNAAEYIAKSLKISRATVYIYLKNEGIVL